MKKLILSKKDKERFFSKIRKSTSGCWLWKGTLGGHKDYGYFTLNYKSVRAHRLSFQIHKYILDSKKDLVCHKCDVPKCVNPDHLFIGDGFSNMQDASKKKRWNKMKRETCIRGHLYTIENTHWYKPPNRGQSHRQCKKCWKINNDKQRRKYVELSR